MFERFFSCRAVVSVALLAWVCGCGYSRSMPAFNSAPAALAAGALSRAGAPFAFGHRPAGSRAKIQHVVIIVQENRGFDNLFQGYPGADTASSGMAGRKQIKLVPVSLSTQYVIDHSMSAFILACDGTGTLPGTNCKNDGFNKIESFGLENNNYPEYVYVPHKESKPYFDMAHEWVLGDEMHQSHLDESFVAHQYIIAAQAESAVDLPDSYVWGCTPKGISVQTVTQQRAYGPAESACFDETTIADELDSAGLSWRFYTSKIKADGGEWSGFQAIKHIRFGPDWKYVITPQKQFITDVGNGQLSTVTWVTPICANSDHVNCGGGHGPSWVTALVNAVGESSFWDSTAIFVTWDDWGGLYDHVLPVYEDYDGTGYRVPLLVISPYAKKNYVSHVMYETGSILRFVEDTFGLARLTAGGSDARSNSPADDCFDFAQKPRRFVPIKAPEGTQFFMQQYDDGRAPDDG